MKTVYLVGSVATKSQFHRRSDIDLAVAGLESADYYPALSDCWNELLHEFTLDLIPFEDVEEQAREPLLLHGIKLAA